MYKDLSLGRMRLLAEEKQYIVQLTASALSHHATPSQARPHDAAPTILRPFNFLRSRIFLPVLLLVRLTQPERLFWMRREWPFMVLRGPHRSCAAPNSAGCREMAVLGTRSRAAVGDDDGAGVKFVTPGRRGERLGRRGVRVVKVLGEEGEMS